MREENRSVSGIGRLTGCLIDQKTEDLGAARGAQSITKVKIVDNRITNVQRDEPRQPAGVGEQVFWMLLPLDYRDKTGTSLIYGDATYACLLDLCSIDRRSFRVDMIVPASCSSCSIGSCPGSSEVSVSLSEY